MGTRKETVAFILEKLGVKEGFSAKPMFGEYGLYADGKIAGLICDDLLYVKILPASKALEIICEKGPPYPGAKPYYIIEEGLLTTIPELRTILKSIGK